MLTGLCAHVKRAAWSRKNLVLRLGTQSYLSGLLTRVSLCAVDSRIATAARAHPSRPTFEPEGPHSRKLGSSYPSCYKLGAAGSDSPVGRTRGGVEVGCFFVCGGGEKSSKGRGTGSDEFRDLRTPSKLGPPRPPNFQTRPKINVRQVPPPPQRASPVGVGVARVARLAAEFA